MKGSGISSVRCTPTIEEPTIDGDIDYNYHTRKYELNLSGEANRIDDGQDIVLNEALCVARQARLDTKVVLQIGKRANATCEFNEEAPCGCRKMNNDDPAPPRRDCGTQEGEYNEGQMEQQDSIGCQKEEHDRAPGRWLMPR